MGSEEATSGVADSPVVVTAGDLIEPSMALALNIHASPGVYALLLGSGISIASGVKTGWGVVEDLVGKVASVRDPGNPDARTDAMGDPDKWWESNCDEPLGYSSLLAAVAPKPASRQALLAGYFEPKDGDDDGDKAPTAAHRAIAQLVKRGSIRVILTTNFDRLMERALQEVGISPQVVHRPEAIDAMKPLAHSQVTVIKLHGDYADLAQRNTVDELESYPETQQGLLERVLDEYGLIVCGWSADWDTALVRAVEGTRSRRYPMFWSTYGQLGPAARRLTTQHSAVIVEGMSADELFTGLMQQVEALDRLSAAPITRDLAVVQLKRALPDPVRRIELFDLVDQAVTQIIDGSTPERRPMSATSATWADIFAASVQGYRADSDILLHLLANGVFHDDGAHDQLWQRAVGRLVRMRDTMPGSYNEYLEKLRHLPALLATWTIGVAAVLSRREELLASVLTRPEWAYPSSGHRRQGPAWYLNPLRVIEPEGINNISRSSGGNGWLYPQSHWLKDELREAFRLVEPSDIAYREACSRFEFLASMTAMDSDNEVFAYPWAGEFFLDSFWGYDDVGLTASVERELSDSWPLLRAGAFGGDLARAQAAHAALVDWRAKNARKW
ncbi:SIR2 family protein [Lysinibacillus sp. NPDC056220]|uniref:SIR2 family protein n=1 Tax=Lysinibacillus sp. NPDC056220 TaxID=3398580 RepID=UPI003BF581C5